MNEPTATPRLVLKTQPNDDPHLTCLFCWSTKCDLCFETSGNGRRAWHGVHEKCAERYGALDRTVATP